MDTLITARKRLVFDEFFLFIMGMQYQREKKQREPNAFSYQDPQFVQGLIEKLPYEQAAAGRRGQRKDSRGTDDNADSSRQRIPGLHNGTEIGRAHV